MAHLKHSGHKYVYHSISHNTLFWQLAKRKTILHRNVGSSPRGILMTSYTPTELGIVLIDPHHDYQDFENEAVDHQRASPVAHQLRRHEAQRGEGLQILVEPGTLHAVAQG